MDSFSFDSNTHSLSSRASLSLTTPSSMAAKGSVASLRRRKVSHQSSSQHRSRKMAAMGLTALTPLVVPPAPIEVDKAESRRCYSSVESHCPLGGRSNSTLRAAANECSSDGGAVITVGCDCPLPSLAVHAGVSTSADFPTEADEERDLGSSSGTLLSTIDKSPSAAVAAPVAAETRSAVAGGALPMWLESEAAQPVVYNAHAVQPAFSARNTSCSSSEGNLCVRGHHSGYGGVRSLYRKTKVYGEKYSMSTTSHGSAMCDGDGAVGSSYSNHDNPFASFRFFRVRTTVASRTNSLSVAGSVSRTHRHSHPSILASERLYTCVGATPTVSVSTSHSGNNRGGGGGSGGSEGAPRGRRTRSISCSVSQVHENGSPPPPPPHPHPPSEETGPPAVASPHGNTTDSPPSPPQQQPPQCPTTLTVSGERKAVERPPRLPSTCDAADDSVHSVHSGATSASTVATRTGKPYRAEDSEPNTPQLEIEKIIEQLSPTVVQLPAALGFASYFNRERPIHTFSASHNSTFVEEEEEEDEDRGGGAAVDGAADDDDGDNDGDDGGLAVRSDETVLEASSGLPLAQAVPAALANLLFSNDSDASGPVPCLSASRRSDGDGGHVEAEGERGSAAGSGGDATVDCAALLGKGAVPTEGIDDAPPGLLKFFKTLAAARQDTGKSDGGASCGHPSSVHSSAGTRNTDHQGGSPANATVLTDAVRRGNSSSHRVISSASCPPPYLSSLLPPRGSGSEGEAGTAVVVAAEPPSSVDTSCRLGVGALAHPRPECRSMNVHAAALSPHSSSANYQRTAPSAVESSLADQPTEAGMATTAAPRGRLPATCDGHHGNGKGEGGVTVSSSLLHGPTSSRDGTPNHRLPRRGRSPSGQPADEGLRRSNTLVYAPNTVAVAVAVSGTGPTFGTEESARVARMVRVAAAEGDAEGEEEGGGQCPSNSHRAGGSLYLSQLFDLMLTEEEPSFSQRGGQRLANNTLTSKEALGLLSTTTESQQQAFLTMERRLSARSESILITPRLPATAEVLVTPRGARQQGGDGGDGGRSLEDPLGAAEAGEGGGGGGGARHGSRRVSFHALAGYVMVCGPPVRHARTDGCPRPHEKLCGALDQRARPTNPFASTKPFVALRVEEGAGGEAAAAAARRRGRRRRQSRQRESMDDGPLPLPCCVGSSDEDGASVMIPCSLRGCVSLDQRQARRRRQPQWRRPQGDAATSTRRTSSSGYDIQSSVVGSSSNGELDHGVADMGDGLSAAEGEGEGGGLICGGGGGGGGGRHRVDDATSTTSFSRPLDGSGESCMDDGSAGDDSLFSLSTQLSRVFEGKVNDGAVSGDEAVGRGCGSGSGSGSAQRPSPPDSAAAAVDEMVTVTTLATELYSDTGSNSPVALTQTQRQRSQRQSPPPPCSPSARHTTTSSSSSPSLAIGAGLQPPLLRSSACSPAFPSVLPPPPAAVGDGCPLPQGGSALAALTTTTTIATSSSGSSSGGGGGAADFVARAEIAQGRGVMGVGPGAEGFKPAKARLLPPLLLSQPTATAMPHRSGRLRSKSRRAASGSRSPHPAREPAGEAVQPPGSHHGNLDDGGCDVVPIAGAAEAVSPSVPSPHLLAASVDAVLCYSPQVSPQHSAGAHRGRRPRRGDSPEAHQSPTAKAPRQRHACGPPQRKREDVSDDVTAVRSSALQCCLPPHY